MHYYQFNIADYRKDTVHLTPIEHYIYRTLIDWYYMDEQPITKETQMVMRRLSLDFSLEQNVLNVLKDFFIECEKGWEHKRIRMEIKDYHEMAEKNRVNGNKGGRPKKTQSVSSGLPDETQNNPTVTLTNNQEPITNNHNINTLSLPATPKADNVPYEKIVSLYHEKLPTLPKVVMLTTKRKGQIAARWKSGVLPDLETWENYFDFVSKSPFLMGLKDPPEGRKRFVADLEWITNESNFTKIWEKKYHGQV